MEYISNHCIILNYNNLSETRKTQKRLKQSLLHATKNIFKFLCIQYLQKFDYLKCDYYSINSSTKATVNFLQKQIESDQSVRKRNSL